MRILATADLHLGSPIRSMAARNPDLAEELARAGQGVLARIVDMAIAEEVDVLAIAGDIFDNDAPDLRHVAQLKAELARAVQNGVRPVLIRGNHDAQFDAARLGGLGEGITLLSRARPTALIEGVAFHGLSFEPKLAGRSALPDYPAPDAARANVGLMHSSLGGSAGHDPYAPCSEADLMAFGYDLWCLGHIHKPYQRQEAGRALVMPGIPQPRHYGERFGGDVVLCDLAQGAVRLETRPVAQLGFAEAQVALDADAPPEPALRAALQGAHQPGRDVALRLFAASGQLTREDLTELTQLMLEDLPGLYLDKLVLQPPKSAAPATDDLTRLMRDEMGSEAFARAKDSALQELRDALPADLRDALADEAGLMEAALADVARRLGAAR